MAVSGGDVRAHRRPLLKGATGRRRPLLVCFSHLRWDFVYQRPQHLMRRAARAYDVLFVEEPVATEGAARLQLLPRGGGITTAVPLLPADMDASRSIDVQRALLAEWLSRRQAGSITLWYYTPMALPVGRSIPADVVIYDNMDELSAFLFAPSRLLALEDELLARADLVFTGGQRLYEAKRHRHPSVHAFPSSVEAAHFAKARRRRAPEPWDQAALPHPRLGFFGVIDERMDGALVAAIADQRPGWSFVMLGPVAKIDMGTLPRRPNLRWLGPKSYDELPDYLAGWDVGLMPFAINEATAFISPTKTLEFLAAGLPVVSTPIADVVRPYGEKGLVDIAADADGFIAKAEALMTRRRSDWLADVDAHIAILSWDRTWMEMRALIGACGTRRGQRAGAARAMADHV